MKSSEFKNEDWCWKKWYCLNVIDDTVTMFLCDNWYRYDDKVCYQRIIKNYQMKWNECLWKRKAKVNEKRKPTCKHIHIFHFYFKQS